MTTSTVTDTAPKNASAPDEPTVIIERQFHQRAGFEQKREIPSQRLTVRIIRNDSSGDLFEIAEAECLDHVCLDGRDVLVGLVGAKRRANDGAGSAATPGLTHEFGDGLCDVMRIRAVLALRTTHRGDHSVAS